MPAPSPVANGNGHMTSAATPTSAGSGQKIGAELRQILRLDGPNTGDSDLSTAGRDTGTPGSENRSDRFGGGGAGVTNSDNGCRGSNGGGRGAYDATVDESWLNIEDVESAASLRMNSDHEKKSASKPPSSKGSRK